MSEMAPNMTDAHIDAVMAALPDEADEAELCALMLTIYSAYTDDAADVIPSLIMGIYTFGEAAGLSRSEISMGLRAMADLYDDSLLSKDAGDEA